MVLPVFSSYSINLFIIEFLKKKKYVFLSAIIIFLLIPFLLRFYKASQFEVDQFWLGTKIYKVVIFRIDSIALGVFAAFLKHWYPKIWFKGRNISFIIGIAFSYFILYTTWLPNTFISKVFVMFFQSIGCVLLLPKFDSIKKAPQLIKKIFTHISLISYSMYLINLALVAEVINSNFPPNGILSAWGEYGIYWIFVLVFSTVIYKYYEKPMMDLRDKWSIK